MSVLTIPIGALIFLGGIVATKFWQSQPNEVAIIRLAIWASIVATSGMIVVGTAFFLTWFKLNTVQTNSAKTEQALLESEKRSHSLAEALASKESERIGLEAHVAVMTRACQVSSERFEILLQQCPVAILGFDCDGQIFEANQGTAECFGLPTQALVHRNLMELVSDREAIIIRRMLRRVFLGHRYQRFYWQPLIDGQKSKVWLVTTFPLRGTDGEINAAMAMIEDVSSSPSLVEHASGGKSVAA